MSIRSRREARSKKEGKSKCKETKYIKYRPSAEHPGQPWVLISPETGEVKSHHESCELAHAAKGAIEFAEHGGKFTRRKKNRKSK